MQHASYGVTAGGDPNARRDRGAQPAAGHRDTLAVRGVFYNDRRGGYINNVPGTFTRKPSDLGIHYADYPSTDGTCPDGSSDGGSGSCVPPGGPGHQQLQHRRARRSIR